MKKITTENRDDIYTTLVTEAEAYIANGHKLTRFEMLKVMDGWDIELNRDSIDLVEKLYADGFVKA
jgi:hypothetical protein